jgi:hypothetical protein
MAWTCGPANKRQFHYVKEQTGTTVRQRVSRSGKHYYNHIQPAICCLVIATGLRGAAALGYSRKMRCIWSLTGCVR